MAILCLRQRGARITIGARINSYQTRPMHYRDTQINGFVAPGFEPVREQFLRNFKLGREVGASACFTHNNKVVVDLWAGHADQRKNKAWKENTLATIFSGTKGLAALCTLRLADQGLIDLDAPISKYWPEFSYHGKSHIPISWILSHKAGLVGANKVLMPWTLKNEEALAASLADQQPWWEPGEGHGYHAITMGWLLGKIIRNVTGKSAGQYFREEIAQPAGLDIHIGLDPREHDRVAKMQLLGGIPVLHRDILGLLSGTVTEKKRGMSLSAFTNPLSLGLSALGNTKTWAEIEQPAANGMANARSMAKLYGILANGGCTEDGYQILSPELLEHCWIERSNGADLVLKRNTRFSHGFMLSQDCPLTSYGPGTRSFGHNGMGGSLSIADPDNNVSFGYVMNKMGTYILVDPRPRGLIDTFYQCL